MGQLTLLEVASRHLAQSCAGHLANALANTRDAAYKCMSPRPGAVPVSDWQLGILSLSTLQWGVGEVSSLGETKVELLGFLNGA